MRFKVAGRLFGVGRGEEEGSEERGLPDGRSEEEEEEEEESGLGLVLLVPPPPTSWALLRERGIPDSRSLCAASIGVTGILVGVSA